MSIPLQNDTFLRALLRKPVPRTPVWIMRQAGRYLPEYRATRERAGDFLTLCTTPELACEVTLQPLARFDLDAAILFSDILTIPHAMGLGLSVKENIGPKFERVVRTDSDIDTLPIPDVNTELRYVMDAVSLIRRELDGRVPLIGFAGSPWTLSTYMVEGGSSREFHTLKKMMYSEPKLLHRLLAKLATAVTDYLNAQIQAGAQAVMIFDTWGGILSPGCFREFSLAYIQQIISGLIKEYDGHNIPSIVFTKGGGQWLESMAKIGCNSLGLDWTTDIAVARETVGNQVALQGNMDPLVLLGTPDRIHSEVVEILAKFGHGTGHVFNLGHGITPDINPEHVQILVDSVHQVSAQYH